MNGINFDSTNIYYAFSTIAQTLAGSIGLLGAFVVLSLQSEKKELESRALRICNYYGSIRDKDGTLREHDEFKKLKELYSYGKMRELLIIVERNILPIETSASFNEELPVFKNMMHVRTEIINGFKTAVWVNILNISIALLIISVIPKDIILWNVVMLSLGLIGATISLGLQVRFLFKTIK